MIKYKHKKFNFPCGETQVINPIDNSRMYDWTRHQVVWKYENDAEIFELLLLLDADARSNNHIEEIFIPYLPYSRQDRNQVGEALSLKVLCNLLNSTGKRIRICDPHSDVATALLDNVVVETQWDIASQILQGKGDHGKHRNPIHLICPDAGALKKINKLAPLLKVEGVVECSKIRDMDTGEITGTQVHHGDFYGENCFIVDDICDGGRTFIEIAKVLREKGAGWIILYVTHGFFTKGLSVFDGLIDEVYTREGKVK